MKQEKYVAYVGTYTQDVYKRQRLGSLEPRIVTDAFAKRLSELPKICPHFHLSLQSAGRIFLTACGRMMLNIVCL